MQGIYYNLRRPLQRHSPSGSSSLSYYFIIFLAAAAAKLLQSCSTLCDPIDGSPPGSPVPGILQARKNTGVGVQSVSHAQLFATLWTVARQASLSITNSQSLLKLMSIKSVMPSNHLILCCPLFLPPSIFPSFRVFSNESVYHIR